jgi:hypothetical protein
MPGHARVPVTACDNEGSVQHTVLDSEFHRRGIAIADLDVGLPVALRERRQEARQRCRADAGLHTDAERRFEVAPAARGRPQLAQLSVDLLDIAVNEAAERGELVVTGLPLEQRPAEFVLQMLDGARQRRLRHVAFRRRAREVARARDGQEVSELVELHCFPRRSGDALLSVCTSRPAPEGGSTPTLHKSLKEREIRAPFAAKGAAPRELSSSL